MREVLNSFLEESDNEEGFTKYIVVKSTNSGPQLAWVSIGKTDFKYTEIKQGISLNEKVYVLPTAGLIKNQEEFRNRLRSRMR